MKITENGVKALTFLFSTSLSKGVQVSSAVGVNLPLNSTFTAQVNSFAKANWSWSSIQLYRGGSTFAYQGGDVNSTTGLVTLVAA